MNREKKKSKTKMSEKKDRTPLLAVFANEISVVNKFRVTNESE